MCDVAPNPFVVSDTEPLANATVPSRVDPSRNSMVPLGTPAPGATMDAVALNVTAWPDPDGLALELTATTELACVTVSVPATNVIV